MIQVTLVGNSAGAISIGLHQLYSPPELFRGGELCEYYYIAHRLITVDPIQRS